MFIRYGLVALSVSGIGIVTLGATSILDAQEPPPAAAEQDDLRAHSQRLAFFDAERIKHLTRIIALERQNASLETRLAELEKKSNQQSQRLDRIAVTANASYPGYTHGFATLEVFRKLPPDYAVRYYARVKQ